MVTNTTKERQEMLLSGKVEIVNNYRSEFIQGKSVYEMSRLLKSHTLAMEVLIDPGKFHHPIISTNVVSISGDTSEFQVNDLELADAVGAQREPTYVGEAIISDHLVEGGLELPTMQ